MARRRPIALVALVPACALAQPCGPGWVPLPAPGAPATIGSLIYDAARDRVMGISSDTGTPRTWQWDGATWSMHPYDGPTPPAGSVAYDSGRQVVVLYRGFLDHTEETWEWKGDAWHLRQAGAVDGLNGADIAYFPPTGQTVRTGGRYLTDCTGNPNCAPYTYPFTTCAWDGEGWSCFAGGGSFAPSMVYDPIGQRLIRAGGFFTGILPHPNFDTQTHAWNGAAWTPIAQTGVEVASPLLYFDPARGEVRGLTPGVKRLVGGQWQIVISHRPEGARFVFDAGRNRLLAIVEAAEAGGTLSMQAWDGDPGPPETLPNAGVVTEFVRIPGQQLRLFTDFGNVDPGYQVVWRKNGKPIPGGTWNSITIAPAVTCEDYADYDYVYSNACGTRFGPITRVRPIDIGVTMSKEPIVLDATGDFSLFFFVGAEEQCTFQWRCNGQPIADGPNVSGATTRWITVTDVRCEQYGVYDCLVTLCGFEELTPQWQVVPTTLATSISLSPMLPIFPIGSTLTFTSSISNQTTGDHTYQWLFNGNPLANGGAISGATSPTMVITNAQFVHSGAYTLQVTSACTGQIATSMPRHAVIRCAGDINGDGHVNFADLNGVLGQFGQTGGGLAGDVNFDGVVNFADLNIVLSNFGLIC